ncbi:MAG: glucose-6-phosphate dehydrogenase [Candidatus Woykebacteria bacterium]
MEKVIPSPSVITIFGATGNLTHTKLVPALYELEKRGFLPDKLIILGAARKNLSTKEFIGGLLSSLQKTSESVIDRKIWDKFSKRLDFYCIDFNKEAEFVEVKNKLDKIEKDWRMCFSRIFYLATAPSFFPVIFEAAKKYKLNIGCDHHKNPARIVIEKPFGADLKTAGQLNHKLDQVFSEEQIYRIDHYLAKESVQNILAFRFANEIFEPILNKNFVDHIQIVMAEEAGIGSRGGYYEEAGALRDIIQNHLLQLLAVTTMREPKRFDAASIRAEKVQLLKDIRPIAPRQVSTYVVRGQYGKGEEAVSYRDEEKVATDSAIETFVALKLSIDNDNWRGVPIYLKTGKRLAKKLASISIQFKEVGHALFENLTKKPSPNLLTFQIQPDEGIGIRLTAKKPGLKMEVSDVNMEFCYAAAFREPLPEAYERLLLDIMLGDQTLFPHVDEVLHSWEIVDNILKGWQEEPTPKFPNYAAGSWGPKEADALIEKDGRRWLAHELSVCQIHFR